jgi:dihydroorotate dehydrogenase
MYQFLRPLLFALDPETAHHIAITALKAGFIPRARTPSELKRRVLGLDFPNPLGLAAGFDKNGEVVDAVFDLGFGFVEVGTVTPRPQAGNPRPRMFRLPADRAIINRLGFNNDGHEAVHRRLARRQQSGIVGVNLGANKDSANRVKDYTAGVVLFSDVADYLTINVSSPNTPGLRDLQEREALARLLGEVSATRARAPKPRPVLLKIAPDLDDDALAAIVAATIAAGIDGIVVSNTTVAREGILDRQQGEEAGGLSGRPLFRPSTEMLAKIRTLAGGKLTLVGTGGVDSIGAARAKLDAGADLMQLYTGLIYEGPGLPARILAGLTAAPQTPARP